MQRFFGWDSFRQGLAGTMLATTFSLVRHYTVPTAISLHLPLLNAAIFRLGLFPPGFGRYYASHYVISGQTLYSPNRNFLASAFPECNDFSVGTLSTSALPKCFVFLRLCLLINLYIQYPINICIFSRSLPLDHSSGATCVSNQPASITRPASVSYTTKLMPRRLIAYSLSSILMLASLPLLLPALSR